MKRLAKALWAKTYQIWRVILRAASEREEKRLPRPPAVGISHEASEEQWRLLIEQAEETLTAFLGDLAEVSRDCS